MEKKEKEKQPKSEEVLEVDNFNWIVPECCLEGWASCPHCLPRNPKKEKTNIGL